MAILDIFGKKRHMEAVVISHVGRVRQNNEDNFNLQGIVRENLSDSIVEEQYSDAKKQCIFAVADGMGGEEMGEWASLISVQSLVSCKISEVEEKAKRSIQRANSIVCKKSRKQEKKIGSTLAAVYVDGDQFKVCNLGDSRVYMMREGVLRQLSVDHTYVQQLIDIGALRAEEARRHPKRHVLMQNIGMLSEEKKLEPYVSREMFLKKGDIFLLCSDGLTDMVSDKEIAEILKHRGRIRYLAKDLVELALEHGGKDNVTVMLVRVKD